MRKTVKVLVPVDFSKYSLETVRYALGLEWMAAGEYCLIHVVMQEDFGAYPSISPLPSTPLKTRLADSEEELCKIIDELRGEYPDAIISSRVVAGFPFKEICRVAEEDNVDLIIIGTHGRTGLAHLLIGSTAERVVQHASCPVLSVKPRIL